MWLGLLAGMMLLPTAANASCSTINLPDGHTSPTTSPMASGGTITVTLGSYCDAFGLNPYPDTSSPNVSTFPQHGTVTMVDSSNGEFTYTNNGDGATSDSFVMTDASDQPFTVNVTIAAPTSSIVVSPNALSAMQAGASFSQSLSATGGSGPYAFTLDSGSPPPGISLSGNTISGTPTQRGSYSFAVKATDNTGATQVKSYSGTVANPTLTLAPASSQGSVGTPFSVTYAPGGGVTPYHDPALEVGATLPPGLTLSGFTLSGTPTTTGTYSFRIVYYDSSTGPGTYFQFVPVTVTIVAAPPSIGSLTPAVGPVTGGTSVTIAGTGFTGATAVTFGGTPAASFSVGSDASISATAPAHAAGAVDVTVTTATSGTVTKSNAFTYLSPAPVANAVSATVAYGSTNNPITLNITGGAATSVAVGTQATHGTATASGTSITYTPTTGYYGADSFTYTATNPSGTSAPASVTVTVANPPAPTAGDKSGVAVAYGTATPIDLASAITGVHSSLAVASGPAHGTTSVSGDVVTYTPAAGYYGADSFSYTATGPGGTSAAATVSLTVGTPAAPVAAAKSGVAVGYGTATSIDLASSIAGVHSSIAVASGPAHGTTSVSGDVVTYTPAAGYYGADSFSYTATGPGGTSAAATVSLTVGTPAAPVAAAKSGVAVGYGTATSIDLASSITGVHSSIAVASGPAHGTTSVSGDVVTYTPAAGYYGADSFSYTATGPGGTSAAATVSLTVGTPAAPVAAAKSGVAVGYGTATSIDLASSIAGVHTSITVASGPAHGTTSVAGDVVTYTPAAGYYGGDSFTYTATGPGGTSSAAAVSLTVGTPAAPVAADKSGVAVAYGAAASIDLSSSITGVHSSIAVSSGPAHGTTSVAGDVVTYTPATGYYGADSFTYTATGPGGTSSAATVSLTVGAPPAPTVVGKSGVAVTYQTATPIDLSSSITGVHTSIAITTAPTHGSVSVSGDVVTYTPAVSYYGPDTFAYAATGPGGTSAAASVQLTVGVPPAPVTADKNGVSVAYGMATPIDLASSITGVHSGIAVASGPAHGTTSVAGDVVTYTPAAGYYGADSFTYTATGPGGTSSAATVSLTVGTPPAPTTTNKSVTAAYDAPTAIDLSAAVTGAHTGIAVASGPAHGTTSVSGDVVTYTPGAGYYGADSFTYTATGPGGTSAAATVTLAVASPPPPIAEPTSTTIAGSTTGNGSAAEIDLSGKVSGVFTSVEVTTQPQHGTVTISTSAGQGGAAPIVTARYTAEVGFQGIDTFQFAAIGPGGRSAPATVTVKVVGSAPIAQNKTAATGDGQTVSIDLTDGATAGPFTAAAIVSVTPSDAASAKLVEGGSADARSYRIDVTTAAHFGGQVVVTYTLSNAFGTSAPATVTLSVTARPDPSQDPNVSALSDAQAESTRQFARTQVDNFMRRAEALHNGGGSSGADMGLQFGFRDMPVAPTQRYLTGEQASLALDNQMRGGGAPPAWGPNGAMQNAAADPRSGANTPPIPGSGKSDGGAAGPRQIGSIATWVGGAIQIGTRDQNTDRAKVSVSTGGLSGGADIKLADGATVGVGIGYGGDQSVIGGGAARVNSRTTVIAGYGSFEPVPEAFVDVLIAHGNLDFKTRRRVDEVNATALGSRDGDMTFGAVSAGIDHQAGSLTWSAYGRAEWTHAGLGSYTETGADRFDLRFDHRTVKSLYGVLGGRIGFTQPASFGSVSPNVRVEWLHEFDGATTQGLDYADYAGPSTFDIRSAGWGREQYQVTLENRLLLPHRWGLDLELSLLGSTGARSGSVRMGLSKVF